MNTIIISIIVLCGCGLLAGAALGIASRVFAVKSDPRIEKIEKILPGANCSGCGNPSCYAYAKSIVEEGAEPNLCVLAADKADEIGKVLGIEVTAKESRVAAVRCYGGPRASKHFIYAGIPSCRAASFFCDGDNSCKYSCLGFGDCVQACPFGGISLTGRNTPVFDRDACAGCGKCADACPKGVIVLVPKSALPHVACNTKYKGKIVRILCPIGCISCGKCVKVCPEKAVSLEDNLVQINYDKCNNCGACIESCPRHIIVRLGEHEEDGAVNL